MCECGMTGAASNLRHALILVSMRNLNSLLLQLYLREKGESLGTVVISVPFTTFYDRSQLLKNIHRLRAKRGEGKLPFTLGNRVRK